MQTLATYAEKYLYNVEEALGDLPTGVAFHQALELILSAQHQCRNVWLIGNGGSASLADHMATDLQLAGVHAIALTNIAALSTYSNDISYHECFSAQLRALAQEGDVLIAISTSGRSENILRGVKEAFNLKVRTIAMSGFAGGDFTPLEGREITCHLHIPCGSTPIIQDAQEVLLHILAYYLIDTAKGDNTDATRG